MILTYTNSKGDTFDLLSNGLRVKDGNFHNYAWQPQTVSALLGESVKGFGKKALHYSTTLAFRGSDQQRRADLNAFRAATETDIISMTPGKLQWQEDYIQCYIVASSTYPSDDTPTMTLDEVDIYAPYPFWFRDVKKSFFGQTASGTFLDYPYDYDYDYYQGVIGYDIFISGHYAPSEFTMMIYGAAVNPMITIGGQVYGIYDTLAAGDYAEIDSRSHTVTKYASGGTKTNIFDLRTKAASIFNRMPAGDFGVSWSGAFGFDIILHEERSEPEWI